MCGIPGSGKSYFAQNCPFLKDCLVISRDKIRFPLLKEEDEYFKYEKIVKTMFIAGINQALMSGLDVIADQASLTIAARRRFKSQVKGYNEINVIWVDAPIYDCIERDKGREGRAYVGSNLINTMYTDFEPPSIKEGFNNIYRYDTTTNQITKIG